MRSIFAVSILFFIVLQAGVLPAEEHPRVLIQRGERFLAMGNLDAALVNYQKVIRHYPGSPAAAEAYNDMGVIFMHRGSVAEAAEAYTKSIALADYVLAKLNLGKLLYHRFVETGREEDRCAAIDLLDAFSRYLRETPLLPAVIEYNRSEIDRFLSDSLSAMKTASYER